MLFSSQAQQVGSQQRSGPKIEATRRFLCRQFLSLCLTLGEREELQVGSRQRDGQLGRDYLHRLPVPCSEAGPQTLVAANDFVDAAFESGNIKRSGDTHRARNVVERIARFQLIEEPEALLRE